MNGAFNDLDRAFVTLGVIACLTPVAGVAVGYLAGRAVCRALHNDEQKKVATYAAMLLGSCVGIAGGLSLLVHVNTCIPRPF